MENQFHLELQPAGWPTFCVWTELCHFDFSSFVQPTFRMYIKFIKLWCVEGKVPSAVWATKLKKTIFMSCHPLDVALCRPLSTLLGHVQTRQAISAKSALLRASVGKRDWAESCLSPTVSLCLMSLSIRGRWRPLRSPLFFLYIFLNRISCLNRRSSMNFMASLWRRHLDKLNNAHTQCGAAA